MKHIRYQFLALLSVSALTFTSCDLIGSIDDMEPDYVVTDLNYITDATSAQTALNGVYASWRSTGVSYLRYGIASMAHTQTQAMVMGVDEFAAENIQTNNSNVETAYTAYYNVINTANTFLVHINKQIPGMTEEKRTEMIAEARCQRALAYLTLLKCFGEYWKQDSQYGVCLFKDELVRDNQVRQRSSVADTYKLISEDLDYAIAHCEQHPADHYHMSSLFAKALKAKMYFAQDNYPEAARLSEEVINEAETAGYELESDYANIFTEQFNSKEMLFAPYTANPNELMDASWFAFSVKCDACSFSLSGVQNKVQQYYEKNADPAETAAYALRCVAKAVYRASEQALKRFPGLEIVFSGGVASNSLLRSVMQPLSPVFAQPQYSTDNAMGVAILAHRLREG